MTKFTKRLPSVQKKLLISVVQLGAMLPVYQIVSKHVAVIL